MVVGSALHALHEVGAFAGWLAPLFGTPAVYLTTFFVAGAVWLFAVVGTAAGMFRSIPRLVGMVGVNVASVLMVYITWLGIQWGTIAPVWPVVALGASIVVTGAAIVLLGLTYTEAVALTEKAGAFVVFAHVLDGVTTAIGIDIIGVQERSPVPEAIMEFAAGLPTAQYVGSGWLFVLVKVALAMAIVALFADYVRDEPTRGFLALTAVGAVGFGPGVYNMLLFLLSAAG
jgi:uncharacterized membrane protein